MEVAKKELERALVYGAPPNIEDEILPVLEEQIKIMNNLDSDDIEELFGEHEKQLKKSKKLVKV